LATDWQGASRAMAATLIESSRGCRIVLALRRVLEKQPGVLKNLLGHGHTMLLGCSSHNLRFIPTEIRHAVS